MRYPFAPYNRPIPVNAFLQTLLGNANWEKIRGARPQELSGIPTTLEDAFKNAQVRFTHFAKAGDRSVIQTSLRRLAVLRSTGNP